MRISKDYKIEKLCSKDDGYRLTRNVFFYPRAWDQKPYIVATNGAALAAVQVGPSDDESKGIEHALPPELFTAERKAGSKGINIWEVEGGRHVAALRDVKDSEVHQISSNPRPYTFEYIRKGSRLQMIGADDTITIRIDADLLLRLADAIGAKPTSVDKKQGIPATWNPKGKIVDLTIPITCVEKGTLAHPARGVEYTCAPITVTTAENEDQRCAWDSIGALSPINWQFPPSNLTMPSKAYKK